jgi:hypothetical protein
MSRTSKTPHNPESFLTALEDWERPFRRRERQKRAVPTSALEVPTMGARPALGPPDENTGKRFLDALEEWERPFRKQR